MTGRVILGALALSAFPALVQLLVHPVLSGGSWWTWASFWVYTLFGVIVPGTLVALRTLTWRADWLVWLGIGWTLGHCLELVAILIGRALGHAAIGLVWIPIVYAVVLLPGLRARLEASRPDAVPKLTRCGLVLGLLFAFGGGLHFVLNVPEISTSPPYLSDPWFHAGNAHEFRDHSPMQDPRIAGEPFNYHVYGYAASAAASLATGQGVAPILLRHSGMAWVFLLTLNLFNFGRTLRGGDLAVGAVAAGLVLFAIDPGLLVAPGLRVGTQMPLYGIYVSTTTLAAQVFLSALLLLLREHFHSAHWRNAWTIGLVAFAGAGSKAMFGPLVLCGMAGLAGWKTLFARRLDTRSLGTLAVLLAATAPPTLFLVLGEASYAESLRWVFGTFPSVTPFFTTLTGWGVPAWLAVVLWFPAFGAPLLAGAVFATWRMKEAGRETDYLVFVWMLLVAALVPVLGIQLRAWSELFFLYLAITPLATIAAVGWVAFARSRRALPILAGVAAVWLATQVAVGFRGRIALANEAGTPLGHRATWWDHAVTHRDVPLPDPRKQPASLHATNRKLALTPEIAAGLEWARLHLPPDAVFAVNVWGASVYGALSEHRAFLDTTAFSVETHRAENRGEPGGAFMDRRELLAGWMWAAPGYFDELRAAGITHLYVDRINGRLVPVDRIDLGRPLFANRHFLIFELSDAN